MNVNAGGFVYLLEAVRDSADPRAVKIYQASTSEMYGNTGYRDYGPLRETGGGVMLNENSMMRPRSPYGVSKLAAHRMVQVYRESFDMFICAGILFNHESPRRGDMFVTRKITQNVVRIVNGDQDYLHLGNLQARRDWGYARDYVDAMWRMLQQNEPEDFVIGTGRTYSVEDFAVFAFEHAQELLNKKLDRPWDTYIKVDPRFYRPAEIFTLKADYSKARDKLKWRPKTKLDDLVKMMVAHDIIEEGLVT
jgi:GDPmannose 4,6-dehydratase